MDELRFQYENDLRLRKQASASVKKTEWLEYLQYLERSVFVTTATGLGFLAIDILEWMLDRQSQGNIGGISAILAMLLLAAAFFRTWSKLNRKYSLVQNRTYEKQPVHSWNFVLIFAICIPLFAVFHNYRWLFHYAWAGFWLFLAGSGYWQLYKVKKNLRAWGILDSEGLDRSTVAELDHHC